MSTDVQSALIDVALWLYHAFFAPGDQFLAKFPELDVAGHGRVVSGLLSTVIWLGAIILIVGVCRFIRNLDRTLTALVVRLYEELQRTGRVAARRLAIAFKSFALERQARAANGSLRAACPECAADPYPAISSQPAARTPADTERHCAHPRHARSRRRGGIGDAAEAEPRRSHVGRGRR